MGRIVVPDNYPSRIQANMARRTSVRRAMSLLELAAVVSIVGLLATAAITGFGHSTLKTGGAEGFVRNISLALNHARRATIATGDNHYLQLNYVGPNVSSYALYRRALGGDVQIDEAREVPSDILVTCSSPQLEFDFDGASLAGYTMQVSGEKKISTISLVTLTGAVVVTETAL